LALKTEQAVATVSGSVVIVLPVFNDSEAKADASLRAFK